MRHNFIVASLVGLAFFSTDALAGTSTSAFNVTLTIVKQCSVSTPAAINFGSAGATELIGATMANSATWSIVCSQGVPYTVGFSSVNDLSSGSPIHQMVGTGSNTSKIQYNLFDSTGGGATALSALSSVISDTGTGASQSKTLKAQIVNYTTAVVPDVYTDTVTMTVTY